MLSEAHFEFENGEVLPWWRSERLICEKSATLSIKALRISGWICKVEIQAGEAGMRKSGFYIATPSNLFRELKRYDVLDRRLPFIPSEECDSMFKTSPRCTFECLLLARDSLAEDERDLEVHDPNSTNTGLILLFLKLLHGDSGYERIDCLRVQSRETFKVLNENTAVIGSTQFTLKEICLR